jgi:hypothetical protein
MNDKQRPFSNRGGEFSYEPKEPDLGDIAEVRQMPLTPEQRDKGYTPGLEVPFPKIKSSQ